jgi:hypothetical protein
VSKRYEWLLVLEADGSGRIGTRVVREAPGRHENWATLERDIGRPAEARRAATC